MTERKLQLEIMTDEEGKKFLYFPFMTISDVHWGTKWSKAKKLAHMLEHTMCDQMKLVGDIIDGEELLKKDKWNMGSWHRQGMAHILRKAANGTDIEYIFGNHEVGMRGRTVELNGVTYEKDRTLEGKSVYDIRFANDSRYTDPAGRNLFIVHGDRYDDHVFKTSRNRDFWYRLGNKWYGRLYSLDDKIQRIPMFEHFSAAALGKKAVKSLINKFMKVDKEIAKAVDEMPEHGGIYGHSHMPGFSTTPEGKIIMNDGCCTEYVQTLVHDRQGNWAILEWHHDRVDIWEESGHQETVYWRELGVPEFSAPPKEVEDQYTLKADRLLRLAYRMWPPLERKALQRQIREKELLIEKARGLVAGGLLPEDEWAAYLDVSQSVRADREQFRKVPVARVSLAEIEGWGLAENAPSSAFKGANDERAPVLEVA